MRKSKRKGRTKQKQKGRTNIKRHNNKQNEQETVNGRKDRKEAGERHDEKNRQKGE